MKRRRETFGALVLGVALFLAALPVAAEDGAILSSRDVFHPVHGKNGMVVSQHALATRVGLDVLERGGNAVDAAVAVGFALAVVLPRAGNLGGGGFMMIHRAEGGRVLALDYRERAPAGARRDMYLDEAGEVDLDRAHFSHLAAGVPGTVKGLALALERYGTMSLADVLAPAIELAEKGFVVTPDLASNLEERRELFSRWPASKAVFVQADGTAWETGEVLVQKDLAVSLRRIAAEGPRAFYEGEIARLIAADMAAHGGLVTLDDLAAYRVAWREPLRGTYRGYEVVSMPPPSSGGVHLIQMLNVLEGYDLAGMGFGSAAAVHVMAETMKLAYADRARYLGDPDFWDVPVAGLTSRAYAEALRARVEPRKARPSAEVSAGDPMPYESPDTTHFSVIDKDGNAVSNTYTLNFSYGSGIVAAGTGILLNNEMDDFSAKPGVPNAYGLVGGEANAVEAGKTPLSSMTPTFVFKDGELRLVTGSPGGSRIITTVLQVVVNVVDHGMNVAAATAAPRLHHQWLPDVLHLEVGFSPDTVALLRAMGHRVEVQDAMGATESITVGDGGSGDGGYGDGGYYGAADPRRPDALALGY